MVGPANKQGEPSLEENSTWRVWTLPHPRRGYGFASLEQELDLVTCFQRTEDGKRKGVTSPTNSAFSG